MAILSQSSSNFLKYDLSVGWRLCTQLSIFLLHDLNCVFGALANPFVCHDETFMTVHGFFFNRLAICIRNTAAFFLGTGVNSVRELQKKNFENYYYSL